MASEAEEVVEEEEAAFFKPFSRGLLGGAEVEVVVLEAEEEGELGQGFLSSDEERSVMMNQFKGRGAGAESFPCVDDLQIRSFDVLVANILAPILMHLAPQFAKYLRNTGDKIALSGVLLSQADRVIEVYSKYFDNVKVEEEEDGWALIVGYLK